MSETLKRCLASQQQVQKFSVIFIPTKTNTFFNGENEKFLLFAKPFQNVTKIQPAKTESMKKKLLAQVLEMKPFKCLGTIMPVAKELFNIHSPPFVESTSNQATEEYKWHKLTSDSNTKSLSDSFEELNECAKRAFGHLAQKK